MLWLLVACATFDDDPTVVARGGGAGFWAPHSATALQGAIDLALPGIEVDVVVSQDQVPVLAADRVLRDGCQRDDDPLDEGVAVDQSAWVDLAPLRCGSLPNPDFPNALVVSDALWTLDDLLQALRADGDPNQRIHLHVQPSRALPAEVVARTVLERWWAADPPQPLLASSRDLDIVAALETEARRAGFELPTVWRVHGESEVDPERVSVQDLTDRAHAARADGVGMAWATLTRAWVTQARSEGLQVVGYPVNTRASLRRAVRWGVLEALTDFPADGPQPTDQP